MIFDTRFFILFIQVTDGLRKLDAVLEGSELKLQVQVQKTS